jgi:hypothetical protein
MKNKMTAKEVITKVKKSAEKEKPSCSYKYIAEYQITNKEGDIEGYLTKYTDEGYVYSITYEDTEGTLYRTETTGDIDEILEALFWGDNPILED